MRCKEAWRAKSPSGASKCSLCYEGHLKFMGYRAAYAAKNTRRVSNFQSFLSFTVVQICQMFVREYDLRHSDGHRTPF